MLQEGPLMLSNLKWFDDNDFDCRSEMGFTAAMSQRDLAEYQFFVAEANVKAQYLCTQLQQQVDAHVDRAMGSTGGESSGGGASQDGCYRLDGSEPMQEREVAADADWF